VQFFGFVSDVIYILNYI